MYRRLLSFIESLLNKPTSVTRSPFERLSDRFFEPEERSQ